VLAALLPQELRLMRRAPMARACLRLVLDAAQVDGAPVQEPVRPPVPQPAVGQARVPRPVPVRQPERAPDSAGSGCCCLHMPLSGRC
jgi:hypothetical protein